MDGVEALDSSLLNTYDSLQFSRFSVKDQHQEQPVRRAETPLLASVMFDVQSRLPA